MPACTDTRFEGMLHAYEVRLLSGDERREFELHMLECEHCFQRAKRLDSATALIREDEDIRNMVDQVAGEAGAEADVVAESKPDKSWRSRLLRPPRLALAAVILLAAVVTINRFGGGGDQSSDVTQSLYLISMRDASRNVLQLELDGLVQIDFVFEDADPNRSYTVAVVSRAGDTVHIARGFADFNAQGLGSIAVPVSDFQPGRYKLAVVDSEASPPVALREYNFRAQ